MNVNNLAMALLDNNDHVKERTLILSLQIRKF